MAALAAPIGERILPNTHVLIRLPSGAHRVIRIIPDTTISLGKFGSFPANALIHRPYNLTFDILDAPATGLRVVSAAEVTRDILGGDAEAEQEAGGHYELEYEDAEGGDQVMRTNRETVDDPLAQKMSWVEIEELKKQGTGSGRDLVQKLLESHSALHQKTPFALQKYTLRKTKKFLRRFTALPLTVQSLTQYLIECKEPIKILDFRDETLALMLSLANVHWGGRWLVVDESGGLLVAAIAERLGLLEYTPEYIPDVGDPVYEGIGDIKENTTGKEEPNQTKRWVKRPEPPAPTRNTITLIHPNEQPNLSLLKYFSYDTNNADHSHPLHTHLRTLNWLQVVSPESDSTLIKPPDLSAIELAAMKTSKRSSYYRKLKRWERMSAIVNDTQQGNFDGLLVAGFMELKGILRNTVHLLKGSAQVVVYSPTREAVAEIADLYSSARKAEWIQRPTEAAGEAEAEADENEDELDPTLLLAPTLHGTCVRRYQVLPGRTHPVMTSRGGGEGCVFHGVRVLPVEGRVQARGVFRGGKKRKEEEEGEGPSKKMRGGPPVEGKSVKMEEIGDREE